MQRFRPVINLAIWATAAVFAALRIGTGSAFMLNLIEALMVLIAAFVAHKTLDLLLPQRKQDDPGA